MLHDPYGFQNIKQSSKVQGMMRGKLDRLMLSIICEVMCEICKNQLKVFQLLAYLQLNKKLSMFPHAIVKILLSALSSPSSS